MAHCADDHRAATEILLSGFNYVQQQQQQQQQQQSGMKPAGRSRRGKKRQNKQPQRGLGVAQLEKIRLEEQRRAAQQIAALHHFNTTANLNLSNNNNNNNTITASVGGVGLAVTANAAATTPAPPAPPIFYLNHPHIQLPSAATAAAAVAVTAKSAVPFLSRGFGAGGVDLFPSPVQLSNGVDRMWDGGRVRRSSDDDGGVGAVLQNFGSEPPDGCSTSSFMPQILAQRNQNQILNNNNINNKCLFPSSIDRMVELSSFQNVYNINNNNNYNKRPRGVSTGNSGGGGDGGKSHASCNMADICELSLGPPGCTSAWDPPDSGGGTGGGSAVAQPRQIAHSPPLPPERCGAPPHAFLSLAVPCATWWRSVVPPGSPSPVSATTTRSSATGSDPSAEDFVSTPMSNHTNPHVDTRRFEPPLATTILPFSGSLDLSLKL